jgi:hypothetical protein
VELGFILRGSQGLKEEDSPVGRLGPEDKAGARGTAHVVVKSVTGFSLPWPLLHCDLVGTPSLYCRVLPHHSSDCSSCPAQRLCVEGGW